CKSIPAYNPIWHLRLVVLDLRPKHIKKTFDLLRGCLFMIINLVFISARKYKIASSSRKCGTPRNDKNRTFYEVTKVKGRKLSAIL
ncbi:MAG: hypothetical protein OEW45_20820, partial [Deltaproteobacteria bacterium]|nr:hypothetical protein [Deltaproteobacteria bacterium]